MTRSQVLVGKGKRVNYLFLINQREEVKVVVEVKEQVAPKGVWTQQVSMGLLQQGGDSTEIPHLKKIGDGLGC